MGKSGKVQVADYHMSQHWGVCQEIDSFRGIYYGEKVIWEGNSGNTSVWVQLDNLFGGHGKEGGVKGSIDFLTGTSTQTISSELAGKYDLTQSTAPAYRGIASLWFHDSDGFAGFKWGSNNPYLRDLWVKVSRLPKTILDQSYVTISSAKEVTVNGSTVTVDGVSAELTQGVYTQVGNSYCKLDGLTLNIDGVDIVVDAADNNVSVGGISEQLYPGLDPSKTDYQNKLDDLIHNVPSGTPSVGMTVNGVVITINYVYKGWFNNGATYEYLSNYTARFAADDQVNPVHFIFEALTNGVWGMGEPTANFDIDKWNAASQTVFNEGYGIAYKWDQQESIEDMIGNVLAHIEGMVGVRPSTGLIEIKLIRGDYDVDTIVTLNRSNFRITDFMRKTYTETTNEIVVRYTNALNEDTDSVSIQNSANIAIQGGITTSTKTYDMFRSAASAMKAAQRDLRTVSAPFATIEGDADRSVWDLMPGDVVKLDYPEPGYEMDGLVCRVLKVDSGKNGTPQIHLNLSEDVFSLPVLGYSTPAASSWENPTLAPTPVTKNAVVTPPLWLLNESGEVSSEEFDYPQTCAIILTATGNRSINQVNLNAVTRSANGDETDTVVGNVAPVGTSYLQTPLAVEFVSSNITFTSVVGNVQPAANVFVLIGDKGETVNEIALITGSSETGWTLARGMFDTIPRAWSATSTVWFFTTNSLIFDLTERSAGSSVEYKLTSVTALGELALTNAPDVSYTLTERPYCPLRPANVMVNGSANSSQILPDGSDSIAVSWCRRNRLLESPVATLWTDGDMTPEDGQTTVVKLFDTSGNIIKSYTGLTGVSLIIPVTDLGDTTNAIIQVSSERDGFESIMAWEVSVVVGDGYGKNYGNNYGRVVVPPTGYGADYDNSYGV